MQNRANHITAGENKVTIAAASNTGGCFTSAVSICPTGMTEVEEDTKGFFFLTASPVHIKKPLLPRSNYIGGTASISPAFYS